MGRVFGFVALVAITALAPDLHATYSVLLRNTDSGEMGGAVVSCVGDFDLQAIFGYARPAEGDPVVFFTQAWYSESNHAQALTWLDAGEPIDAVLAKLTDPTFDADASERQYHFIQADAALTWTGTETLPYAAGLTGSYGPWRYSVTGNILTSAHVLESAERSLQTESGPIEERLLRALEAGNDNDEGDSRCTPLPGDSAYVEVRDATGAVRVRHSVVDTGQTDPLAAMRDALALTPPVSPTHSTTNETAIAPTAASTRGDASNGNSNTGDSNGGSAPSNDDSSAPPSPSPSKVNDQRSVGCDVSRGAEPRNATWLACALLLGITLRRRAKAAIHAQLA